MNAVFFTTVGCWKWGDTLDYLSNQIRIYQLICVKSGVHFDTITYRALIQMACSLQLLLQCPPSEKYRIDYIELSIEKAIYKVLCAIIDAY